MVGGRRLARFYCIVSPHAKVRINLEATRSPAKARPPMRIVALTAYIVQLPLRREIKHASATRRENANLLIRCRLSDGSEGWGEGVPRSYVTGETPEGALQQLAATPLLRQLQRDCATWPDVIQLCGGFNRASTNRTRAATRQRVRCAVELSILDALGHSFGQPVSEVVQHYAPARAVHAPQDRVRYSTTITAEAPAQERLGLKMRLYGFRQCKVKVGVAGADDAQRLRRIRFWIGRRMDLRLDANEAWRVDELPERSSRCSAIASAASSNRFPTANWRRWPPCDRVWASRSCWTSR